MATIRTIAPNTYEATFNCRQLTIAGGDDDTRVIDRESGEIIVGGELNSVMALVAWHRKSRRKFSELPVIATIR